MRAVWRLRRAGVMTGRVIAAAAIACLAIAATIESGQSRFEATDRSDIKGVPGLRIINVRDNVLKTCYAVFLAELADPVDVADRIEFTDIGNAVAVRNQRLADLVVGFERERGAIPGTLAPDPLRYQWQADSAQVDFALTALNNAFARLEQDLRRAPRTAITAVPQACSGSERAAH
jgi:hypothetical protein